MYYWLSQSLNDKVIFIIPCSIAGGNTIFLKEKLYNIWKVEYTTDNFCSYFVNITETELSKKLSMYYNIDIHIKDMPFTKIYKNMKVVHAPREKHNCESCNR
jgi:hypothetical protein